jgi:titin
LEALPNGWSGIELDGDVRNTLIGGPMASARNVISGGVDGGGISIEGVYPWMGLVSGTVIQGNFIGIDATGTMALAGQDAGGIFDGGHNTSIIGNVISGWAGPGIGLEGSGHTIQGNWIGTDKNGQPQLDINGRNLLANGPGIVCGNTGNVQIGGPMSGQGNIIAYNNGPGVFVGGNTGTQIEGNSIYGNAGLGIDLSGGGVPILNDSLGHAGANNFQDFPVLTGAMVSGSNVAFPVTVKASTTSARPRSLSTPVVRTEASAVCSRRRTCPPRFWRRRGTSAPLPLTMAATLRSSARI